MPCSCAVELIVDPCDEKTLLHAPSNRPLYSTWVSAWTCMYACRHTLCMQDAYTYACVLACRHNFVHADMCRTDTIVIAFTADATKPHDARLMWGLPPTWRYPGGNFRYCINTGGNPSTWHYPGGNFGCSVSTEASCLDGVSSIGVAQEQPMMNMHCFNEYTFTFETASLGYLTIPLFYGAHRTKV